jgi:hypothetical protein
LLRFGHHSSTCRTGNNLRTDKQFTGRKVVEPSFQLMENDQYDQDHCLFGMGCPRHAHHLRINLMARDIATRDSALRMARPRAMTRCKSKLFSVEMFRSLIGLM